MAKVLAKQNDWDTSSASEVSYKILDYIRPEILKAGPDVRLEMWRIIKQWNPDSSDFEQTLNLVIFGQGFASFSQFEETWLAVNRKSELGKSSRSLMERKSWQSGL